MTTYVLDSFALLALERNEAGAARVEEILDGGYKGDDLFIASVNLGEVVYKTIREADQQTGRSVLTECLALPITVISVDEALAIEGAIIKGVHPISYADCIAAALAQRLGAKLVTGDRDFEKVPDLDIEWLPDS
jgi:predicted nucleic acid-binding protein